jgi:ABC-type branched-subunit amino acid transport system substrate-binding protein
MAVGLLGLLTALHLAASLPTKAQGFAQSPTPQERGALARAKAAVAAGDHAEAARQLDRFLKTSPTSEARAEALTLLGHVRLQERAYQQAIDLLSEVVASATDHVIVDRARLDLGAAYGGAGKKTQAAAVLGVLATSDSAPELRRQAYDLLSGIALESRDVLRAVTWLMDERALPGDLVDTGALDARVRDIIARTEEARDLESVASAFAGRFPADASLVRAGQLYGASGDLFDQDRVMNTFLAEFPQHEWVSEARKIIEANRARVRTAKSVIVLPIPYQGSLQPYATSILRGAQLAVDRERAEGADLSVVLAARDYGGDLSRLSAVLDDTCREARCVGIVGPVLSREATTVASRAASWRVPAVSPTATGAMPQNRYLFRAGLTAPSEGAAAARYAAEHLGVKRFAILAPQDRYSQDVVTAFSNELARIGARIVFSGTYEPGAVDFGREIKGLKEADLKQEGVLEQLPPEVGGTETRPREPVYTPGFDAIFLPGDADTAGLLASQLRFHDIAVPLLGASGWNDRSVIKSGGRFVDDAIFADVFFSDAQDPLVQRFVKEYRARYRVAPDVFAALAYDATTVLVRGLKAGATSGDRLRDELTRIADYTGITGLTGFGSDGEAQRKLSWIQIRNGRFVPAL